jgi:hypothetical protein
MISCISVVELLPGQTVHQKISLPKCRSTNLDHSILRYHGECFCNVEQQLVIRMVLSLIVDGRGLRIRSVSSILLGFIQ